MKKLTIFIFSGILVASCTNFSGSGSLKNEVDTVSYTYGVYFGKGIQKGELTHLNTELIARGIEDVVKGKNDTMQEYLVMEILNNYYMSYSQQKVDEKYADVKKEGEDFLAKNSTEEGIQTTASGLQYQVLREGEGPTPGPDDVVLVHYKGSLVDGTVFESSRENGEDPIPLNVNSVIPGWTEALQLMNKGAIWKVFIPYELAYGNTERPNSPIKPYSALIFEIELLDINPEE